MKLNDFGYKLNTATASEAQVEFVRNIDKITHTSYGINHQKLLSSQTIRIRNEYISVFPPPKDPNIVANNQPDLLISTGFVQEPQTLQLPAAQ